MVDHGDRPVVDVQPGPGDWSLLHTTAGLRLHGQYQDSGFSQPRYLAQRGDGQVVQLTRLPYLVLAAVHAGGDPAGGDLAGIAARVGAQYGRALSAANVAYLLTAKLIPLGLVSVDVDAEVPQSAPRLSLLLGVKGGHVLIPVRAVSRLAAGLSRLHHPVVLVAVLAGFATFDTWLFAVHGAIAPLLALLAQPAWILAAMGLSLAGMVFHELGHASACHYGGARPGAIGYGLYLIWPATYTDVTDVYRISRAGRVRTDLGGVYFNLIFLLAMGGCYALTGQPLFLAVAFISHYEILQQLLPVVRMDGYFILGDLAGIPDLFGKVKPILASMWPGHAPDPRVAGLRRGARITVTCWVLVVVPVLAANLGYALWNSPRILAVGTHTFTAHWYAATTAFTSFHLLTGLADTIGMLLLVTPLAGLAYLLAQLSLRLTRVLTARCHRVIRGDSGVAAAAPTAEPPAATSRAGVQQSAAPRATKTEWV